MDKLAIKDELVSTGKQQLCKFNSHLPTHGVLDRCKKENIFSKELFFTNPAYRTTPASGVNVFCALQ
jgi:hypothetical protein